MPARVLLVDDERPVLDLFKLIFELEGWAVQTAESAAEGVQLLATQDFDIVVTDMRMETPAAGYDVVRAAALHSPRPLIVILSAFYLPEREWKSLPVDSVIVKGTRIEDITATLHHLLPIARTAHPDP